jgi:glycosyltransferase involved in cell wall biosynthesis
LNSLNEGYPTVLIEAQACGLQIIATDVGGVGEIIQNQGLERLVSPGDVTGYLQGLLELYPQIEGNRSDRKSRFSRTWDDVADDITQELRKLIGRKNE